MNEDQRAGNNSEPFAEAQRLLDNRLWDAGRALWVQGEKVIIFFNPSSTEYADRFDVPVTVRALGGSTAALEGSLLVLRSVGPLEEVRTYKERINSHGLAIFRGVEKGSYRPTLIARESLISSAYRSAAQLLTDLRRSMKDIPFVWQQGGWSGVALANDRKEHRAHTHTNTDRSLNATLESDAGNLLLRLQTTKDRWVGNITPFSWVSLTDEVDTAPDLIEVLNDLRAATSERITAAARLAEIGGSEVVSVFRAMLNDPDSDVREAVSCALAAFEVRTRFFTILAWDKILFDAYVAEVNLGPAPKRYELSLPERALSPEELSPNMVPLISKSIKCALTENHDLMAWRQLLERDNIHPRIRSLIEDETNPAVVQ